MTQAAAKRRSAHQTRALAAELVETLQRLGGAAHRDVVLDRAMAARRDAGKTAEPEDRLELARAFEVYRDAKRKGDEGALFTLPFGEGSLRWALVDAGSANQAWLEARQAPGRRVPLLA